MDTITSGVQQISTWGTGTWLIYLGALGIVASIVAAIFSPRVGAMGVLIVVAMVAIGAAATGISRSVYGYFRSASLETPATGSAFAALYPPGVTIGDLDAA